MHRNSFRKFRAISVRRAGNRMTTAANLRYQPTKHAIERAELRFGIAPEVAAEWFNDLMRKAKYVAANGKNGLVYQVDDIRLVVDGMTSAIITVHDSLSADFLKPVLERELRKLKREYTRLTRRLELEYAEALQEIADMAVNRARARNPKTRTLIEGRIAEKQAYADGIVGRIERLQDEWQAKERAIEVISE